MYISKHKYNEYLKQKIDFKDFFKNLLKAFIFGGVISIIGELLVDFYNKLLNFSIKDSLTLMLLSMILIAAILSAFGIYDKITNIVRSSGFIPIVGFSNAAISSAMEYKSEGFFLGIGANVFKLVGSVISMGVFFAFISAIIKYLFKGL